MGILEPFHDEKNDGVLTVLIPTTILELPLLDDSSIVRNGIEYYIAKCIVEYPNGTDDIVKAFVLKSNIEADIFEVGEEAILRTQLEGQYKGSAVLEKSLVEEVDLSAILSSVSSEANEDGNRNDKTIRELFPNYEKGLLQLIYDKPFKKSSGGNKKIIYQLPLASTNKGFDFYELNKMYNGRAYFEVVTMLGFKTVLKTKSELVEEDLSPEEWLKLIVSTTMQHFTKEEYQELKKGYVKVNSRGCFVLASLFIILSCTLILS